MEETKTEILEAAKTLLEIKDDKHDGVLEIIIADVTNAVLSYCRLEVLPRQLESFIPLLAARRFTENTRGAVKSISEGDRRVDYDSSDSFLDEYKSRLNPFVSRKVFVPTDLDKGDTKNDKSI